MSEEKATVDFETDKIESRPNYPPKPVGVAIRWPGGQKEWLSWGHPTGNNTDIGTARSKLAKAYSAKDGVIFHNAAFDLDVAEVHLGLRPPEKFDDTLYLSFLKNPFEPTISLKPMSEKYLDMPPEEQLELKDWILQNVKEARRRKTKWGEYISQAPGDLVGRYALGDVDRTFKLYRKFRPEIEKRGMSGAYTREIECTKVTLEMERSGVRVDTKHLKSFSKALTRMDEDLVYQIQKKLGVANRFKINPNFNLNSGKQLADALIKADKLDQVIKTEKGSVSTSIDNLTKCCNDKELLELLAVHSVCEKYHGTFVEPWIEQAARTGGRILPHFNQVRNRSDDGGGGARSGRLSSSDPNMQNIAANVEESKNRETLLKMQEWLRSYDFEFHGLRDFIIPDEDTVLVAVDYNQQELRILAHFERGVLMRAYLENPTLDIHTFCQQLVKEVVGIEFPRKSIKITVFGIVYGMGIDKLANSMGVDRDTAKQVRDGIYKAVPGIERLMRDLKNLANRDRPLRTWGGREYFCEEPKYDKKRKRWMSFEYKMLNYLIQPSAADCTKQGMINVSRQVPDARIAIQVHDELVCMVKKEQVKERIVKAMCDVEFNVPMLAEAKTSRLSWARVSK